jgi:hypothetical protein
MYMKQMNTQLANNKLQQQSKNYKIQVTRLQRELKNRD